MIYSHRWEADAQNREFFDQTQMNRHLFWTLDGFCFTVVKIVYSNWFNDCNLNAFNYVFTDVEM